ncbi:hypothetical protein CSC3H3_15110 [Thalassospira marina]|uniref:Uncharacterized protein n=1 Tax=Thalassospira marina TaxID=2048283 RepID=A0ABM6QBE5_9PROT|nr:hypothetical protein CSC3H3_15110 [Thalassospira marina]
MGADIGECPFDLSTVRHGVFILYKLIGKPIKTAQTAVMAAMQIRAKTQHKTAATIAVSAFYTESGSGTYPVGQIGGCLRDATGAVKNRSKLLFVFCFQ